MASSDDEQTRNQDTKDYIESLRVPRIRPEYELLAFFEAFLLQGVTVALFKPGHLVFNVPVAARLTNGMATLHGGAVASLVDMSGTYAAWSVFGPRKAVATDINISYLLPTPTDGEVEVEAKLSQVSEAVVVLVNVRDSTSRKYVAQGRLSLHLPTPKSKL